MIAPMIYIIEDEGGMRDILAIVLRDAQYRVQAFLSAEDFFAHFEDDPAMPRCMISDLRMPGMGGLGLQERLMEKGIRMPLIFLTAYAEVPHAVQAMKRGALDFLEKPFELPQLLACVEKALAQEAEVCQKLAGQRSIHERLAKLTPREREVLDLLVTAHSTKEIASKLNINAKTVFVHRARVMEKMGADNLVELSQMVAPIGT
jgi:FixJ family two-component response regulator